MINDLPKEWVMIKHSRTWHIVGCGDWGWTGGWYCRPGWRQAGWWSLRRLSLPVSCFMVRILPASCLLNILYFTPSLSGGNLFTDWATMVASLLGPQPDAVVVVCWTSKKNWPSEHLDYWWCSLAAGVWIAFVLFDRGALYLTPGILGKRGGPVL